MNVTLSIEDEVVRRAREVARRQNKSLNQMIREYLGSVTAAESSRSAVDDLFALIDAGGGDSAGRTWSRDEVHER
jgi:hypothetical protein